MSENYEQIARQRRLSVMAKAPHPRIIDLWAAFGADPGHALLRAPEIGTVMVQGRAGATGAPFHLGEVTVTRCSVRLDGGAVGHGYVQGRSAEAARIAALADAMCEAGEADGVEAALIGPLEEAARDAAAGRAARAAATRVEFFTLVRGEDAT